MKRINKYILLFLLLGGISPAITLAEPTSVVEFNKPVASQDISTTVMPSAVVKAPTLYLNKIIKFSARFDKFSTLGLDYPQALRKTEDYITFLIYRDDTTFDIPLSEMKLFMKRDDAQKFIDLKSKDKVQVSGKVFSDALGDAWVDVINMEIIK